MIFDFFYFREGHHAPIYYQKKSQRSSKKDYIVKIFHLQYENLLLAEIQKLSVVVQQSFLVAFNNLSSDCISVCEKTMDSFADWKEQRIHRITGSICYMLYTYYFNKNADWKNKSKSAFYAKDFKSIYTKYGKSTESEAWQVFEDNTKKNIVETGLVVSSTNPWLSYFPEGIIFEGENPVALLEIEYPVVGKKRDSKKTWRVPANIWFVLKKITMYWKKNTNILAKYSWGWQF